MKTLLTTFLLTMSTVSFAVEKGECYKGKTDVILKIVDKSPDGSVYQIQLINPKTSRVSPVLPTVAVDLDRSLSKPEIKKVECPK